jgi:hypothetical protein
MTLTACEGCGLASFRENPAHVKELASTLKSYREKR